MDNTKVAVGDMNMLGNADELVARIRQWGQELGFQQTGISGIDLKQAETRLQLWLADGRHGEMTYMARHGTRRSRPAELLAGTCRVISLRMNYLPATAVAAEQTLGEREQAYIARYALGRDYHKLIRKRLQQLADKIVAQTGACIYRPFVDSAPVMEKPLASQAGLGWIGKHTNLIHPQAGSWFFLGELYTDLSLPVDAPFPRSHCGSCSACIQACPTGAITAPYQLDARRCISYLTIELRSSIPEEFRPMIGNRIFGCDDCQLVCPWNRFAHRTAEADFNPRHGLDTATLLELLAWTEAEFLRKTEGSAIRRIGYACWSRNIVVALGNAATSGALVAALDTRLNSSSELVREHVQWALRQHNL